jgi:hypothetical protein
VPNHTSEILELWRSYHLHLLPITGFTSQSWSGGHEYCLFLVKLDRGGASVEVAKRKLGWILEISQRLFPMLYFLDSMKRRTSN